MAVSHALTTRQQVFGWVLETTTGTPVVVAAANATDNVYNPKIKYTSPTVDRPGQGTAYTHLKPGRTSQAADITFENEVYGSATVPPWGDLLKASGMTLTSRTYTLASGSATNDTVTVAHYQDGSRMRSAAGCMFNWVMTGKAGEFVKTAWTGRGVWVAPATTTMITPTYSTVWPPALVSATFTIGGTAYTLPGFELEIGNNVILRPDISTASGFRAAYITDRQVKVRVSPEALALGTKDWYAAYEAGTTGALNVVIGATANNIITITAAGLTLSAEPDDEDIDGILHDKVEFLSTRVASAGDDDLVIVFS